MMSNKNSAKKRVLSIFLCIILAFTLLPAAFAGNTEWDGAADKSWYTGKESESVFEIGTAAELAGLRDLVNTDSIKFTGKTIKLTANIDLNDIPWEPIGQASYPFCGILDGQFHVISGLNVNVTGKSAGLIGYMGSRNNINTGQLNNTSNKPVLFGDGGVTRLVVKGTVTGDATGSVSGVSTGGIVGATIERAGITLAYLGFEGSVSGAGVAAGILGQYRVGNNVFACYNRGDITAAAENAYAGGIIGNHTSGQIQAVEGCYNTGTITAANAAGIGISTAGGPAYSGNYNTGTLVGTKTYGTYGAPTVSHDPEKESNNYYLASCGATETVEMSIAATQINAALMNAAADYYYANVYQTSAYYMAPAWVDTATGSGPILAWELLVAPTEEPDPGAAYWIGGYAPLPSAPQPANRPNWSTVTWTPSDGDGSALNPYIVNGAAAFGAGQLSWARWNYLMGYAYGGGGSGNADPYPTYLPIVVNFEWRNTSGDLLYSWKIDGNKIVNLINNTNNGPIYLQVTKTYDDSTMIMSVACDFKGLHSTNSYDFGGYYPELTLYVGDKYVDGTVLKFNGPGADPAIETVTVTNGFVTVAFNEGTDSAAGVYYTLTPINAAIDLKPYASINVGEEYSAVSSQIEYTLSLRNISDLMAVEVEFEVDGNVLEFSALSALNGFVPMITDGKAINWTTSSDGKLIGKITLMYSTSLGGGAKLTSVGAVDIAKFIFIAKAPGSATVKLTRINVAGITNGDEYAIENIDLEKAEATAIVRRPLTYDLNGDGKVDIKDLVIVMTYCQYSKDDGDDWNKISKLNNGVTADMCDFNNDDIVNMLDLVDLFLHYS